MQVVLAYTSGVRQTISLFCPAAQCIFMEVIKNFQEPLKISLHQTFLLSCVCDVRKGNVVYAGMGKEKKWRQETQRTCVILWAFPVLM